MAQKRCFLPYRFSAAYSRSEDDRFRFLVLYQFLPYAIDRLDGVTRGALGGAVSTMIYVDFHKFSIRLKSFPPTIDANGNSSFLRKRNTRIFYSPYLTLPLERRFFGASQANLTAILIAFSQHFPIAFRVLLKHFAPFGEFYVRRGIDRIDSTRLSELTGNHAVIPMIFRHKTELTGKPPSI